MVEPGVVELAALAWFRLAALRALAESAAVAL